MTVQLTPSLVLTNEHVSSRYGFPVLVDRINESIAYGPADIMTKYRMTATAAHFVVRFGKCLEGAPRDFAKAFLSQWPDGPQLED